MVAKSFQGNNTESWGNFNKRNSKILTFDITSCVSDIEVRYCIALNLHASSLSMQYIGYKSSPTCRRSDGASGEAIYQTNQRS